MFLRFLGWYTVGYKFTFVVFIQCVRDIVFTANFVQLVESALAMCKSLFDRCIGSTESITQVCVVLLAMHALLDLST